MYQDMKTGVINLMGVRNIQLGDCQSYSSYKGRYTISIQYKGMANIVYYYEEQRKRDAIFEEIRNKLIKIKESK